MTPCQFISLFVLLLISGCATTVSVADLRTTNEGSSSIRKQISYDHAYRILVSESRRCFSRLMPGAKVNVNGDIYAERKRAEVSIEAALLNSSIAEVLFEIQAISPDETEIKTYYRKKSTGSVERAMRSWLDGNSTICNVEE